MKPYSQKELEDIVFEAKTMRNCDIAALHNRSQNSIATLLGKLRRKGVNIPQHRKARVPINYEKLKQIADSPYYPPLA